MLLKKRGIYSKVGHCQKKIFYTFIERLDVVKTFSTFIERLVVVVKIFSTLIDFYLHKNLHLILGIKSFLRNLHLCL